MGHLWGKIALEGSILRGASISRQGPLSAIKQVFGVNQAKFRYKSRDCARAWPQSQDTNTGVREASQPAQVMLIFVTYCYYYTYDYLMG
jgi:hypothetical protein